VLFVALKRKRSAAPSTSPWARFCCVLPATPKARRAQLWQRGCVGVGVRCTREQNDGVLLTRRQLVKRRHGALLDALYVLRELLSSASALPGVWQALSSARLPQPARAQHGR
jgi:hypothetical protein